MQFIFIYCPPYRVLQSSLQGQSIIRSRREKDGFKSKNISVAGRNHGGFYWSSERNDKRCR